LHVKMEITHYDEMNDKICDIDMNLWDSARNAIEPISFHRFHRQSNWFASTSCGRVSLIGSYKVLTYSGRLYLRVPGPMVIFSRLAGTGWARQLRLFGRSGLWSALSQKTGVKPSPTARWRNPSTANWPESHEEGQARVMQRRGDICYIARVLVASVQDWQLECSKCCPISVDFNTLVKRQGGPKVRAVRFCFGMWWRIMNRIGDLPCLVSCQYNTKLSDFWRENLARCLIR
jgi:hypothetical protein